MRSYVWRELARNPRRTLAATAGVVLGVGLFSAVLFFVDGSGATLTARAVAPLALDMQRVLTSPLGNDLRLEEQIGAGGSIAAGQLVMVTLRVTNGGAEAAHDVVVQDEAPPPLRYLPGSTALDGRPLRDVGGGSPLSQGVAGLGRNIGTIAPGATVAISYRARAARSVGARELRPAARVSSRESLEPTAANGARRLTLEQLRERIAAIPGVASADGLAFVDLPPGSLSSGGVVVRGPLRVFAFDRRYREHYPSIRIVAGAFGTAGGVLSAEASRTLDVGPGGSVTLRLPAGRRLTVRIGGVADLSGARPLFSSRRSRSLEAFLYVPQSIVLTPQAFAGVVVPALRAQAAALGGVVKSLPLEEVDVRVERARLRSSPAAALGQTRAVARSIGGIAPRQDYLIDNISNTLLVARADAAVGKRMFVFLGLPAILLAAVLAAYAGSVLAAAQRREHATLRLRGADRGHLLRMLGYRTFAVAGAGSALGVAGGFLSALAILGPGELLEAAPSALVLSGAVALGGGVLATAAALFVPGRRALAREIAGERRELALPLPPAWWRLRLDVLLLAAAALAELVLVRTGGLDAQPGSVFAGRSVSLPSYLLVVPLVAWLGGVLLSVRLLLAVTLRLAAPGPPLSCAPLRGLAARSVRRRPWQLAAGMAALGLVIAFGTSVRGFIASYDSAARADAEFVVGSDLRITPGAGAERAHEAAYAAQLRVSGGLPAVTPVLSGLENSLVIGAHRRVTTDLAAIDPATFGSAARLSGSSFRGRSPAAAMAALRADPLGALLDVPVADDLGVERGDRIAVVVAPGTAREARRSFRVAGLFTRLSGFARPPDIVVGLGAYRAATRSDRVDFFLARGADDGHSGLVRAEAALRGLREPLAIETPEGAFDRDRSSLTALDVRSLVDLGSLFTLLMSAAVVAIFTFGLILQRRREFVFLRAQGMHAREVGSLVLGEAALMAVGGLASGLLAGAGSGYLLVQALRRLFILPPGFHLPAAALAGLVLAAAAATILSAIAALLALRRLRPTEILREP
jgi:putative ABC transport system permease protein